MKRDFKSFTFVPEFSDDFITDCEMDTDINLSLINGSSPFRIFDASKTSKCEKFPHVLFKEIVINENRIFKTEKKTMPKPY